MAETVLRVEPSIPPGASVAVAYVCGNTVEYCWHRSLMELIAYDSVHQRHVAQGGFVSMRCGTNGLTEARNKAVRTFLDDTTAEWLWWIDTDMGFAPDTVARLVQAADPLTRPVVGALCFMSREDHEDDYGGYRATVAPTIFDWVKVEEQYGWAIRWQFPTNTLTSVGGTGAGCVLVHRSVFEKIQAAHGDVWYDRVPNTTTGQLIGEDLSFCLRAGALKIPMFVHTGVGTNHYKPGWLSSEDYWRQVAIKNVGDMMARQAGEPVPEVTP